MEEGCFEFATRWVPRLLMEKSWTCAEAVELANWKKVLPAAVPRNALARQDCSLELALSHAVRIRNSAVHRHLCDNTELKCMARQAEGLMVIFADVTRESKLHRLEIELSTWDVLSRENRQAARSKLEEALREIGERPVDDSMDWTPNTTSLQEVSSGPDYDAEEDCVDEMDLD